MPRELVPTATQLEIDFLRCAQVASADELSTLSGFDGRTWRKCKELRAGTLQPESFLQNPVTRSVLRQAGNVAIIEHILSGDDEWILI
jgi:hypothetical protein